MTRKKYEFTEQVVDRNGVRRIYGYDAEGRVTLLNARHVHDEYKLRGLTVFQEVV